MSDLDAARRVAQTLPRAYQVHVRGRLKFRVGSLVFASFTLDEEIMGFGFPKEQREGLVAAEPLKFLLPEPVDLRYNWVRVRLAAVDDDEVRELVIDSWRMCVPKKLSRALDESLGLAADERS